MSSWFSDLAGKAENILNKIDQNAASVLKNDTNDRDQLIEVKTGDDVVDNGNHEKKIKMANGSPAIRSITSNALKLPKTPKKTLYTPIERQPADIEEVSIKYESKLNNIVNGDDGAKLNLPSNASNSSRRSSCSSRTEGIQTVIEYPIAKHSTDTLNVNGGDPMQTSTGSLHSSVEDKNEMMASRIIVTQMKTERDQMKTEIADLKNQLVMAKKEDLVSEITATRDLLATDKESLQRKLDELEEANNGYVKTISQLEVSVAKMHEATMDLNEKLTLAKTETEQAVFELQQYRSRAQHTLQMKDELIAELKSFHAKGETTDDTDIDAQCKQIELATMKQERDTFFEENNMLRNQLNANKQIIHSLESKIHEIEMRSSESEKSLSNALKQEKLKSSQLEETMRTQAKELKVVRDELKRQQTITSTKLHEKENELTRLRTKLSQQQNTPTIPTGIQTGANTTDDRIYSLTQSLVQKQNSLEAITAERNAIRFQLEKLENQHRETMTLLRHQRLPQIINVNDTDDAKSQVPNFMRENPFDTRVARRMKRAYSSLDAAGVRLGVFLRRYPLVRTMTIVYVAVLHLWVMFVLLSSTPNQTN
ncbi:golgin-84 [Sitodiplosis mosellana]|uniref:golgin-84 n=1 Tax=Sitodiplosis mosellana TaxID=263140 RepID=UPI002444BF4A|nr:golgin-84 [Sitodiplosis mosellana]